MCATLAAIPAPLMVYDEHTDQVCYADGPAQAFFVLDGEQPPVRWSSLCVWEAAREEPAQTAQTANQSNRCSMAAAGRAHVLGDGRVLLAAARRLRSAAGPGV